MNVNKITKYLRSKLWTIADQLAMEHALYAHRLTTFLHNTIGLRGTENAQFALLFVGATFFGIMIASLSAQ